MHRLLHRLQTAFAVAAALSVTLALLIRHPARVVANRRSRRIDLAGMGANPQSIRSLLYVKLDGLGDFVLATPFLRALRSRFTAARLVIVVDQWLREPVASLGIADEVLGFDWRGGAAAAAGRAARFARERLAGPFDLAVVPRWEVDLNLASLLAFLSPARVRVGFSRRVSPRKRVLNLFNDNLYSHVLEAGAELHEVEKYLLFARGLGLKADDGRLSFRGSPLPSEVEAAIEGSTEGRRKAPIVTLGIGAMGEPRRWPSERFAAVVSWILKAYSSATVVLLGGPTDVEGASAIRARSNGGPRVLDLTGRLTIGQSFELLRRSTLFVGNDSGPKHLAAAAGIPVVEIFSFPAAGGDATHFTAVNRYRAWGVPAATLQPERAVPPCTRACVAYEPHCIATISADEVVSAVKKMLGSVGIATDSEGVA